MPSFADNDSSPNEIAFRGCAELRLDVAHAGRLLTGLIHSSERPRDHGTTRPRDHALMIISLCAEIHRC